MAAAACSMSGNRYESPSGLLIDAYVGDVTKARADGIVVSEGTRFQGMGFVAQTLVKMDSHFETNRNKLILREKTHFKPWTVYTTGECAEFNCVIHAIVIPRSRKQHIDEWKGKMTSLYKKIFSEAENKGVSILALPLLGSGKGQVDPTEAVEVAVHAVFSYKKTSLVKVLLVSHRDDIVDMLATQCAYLCSAKGGKALDLPRTYTNTGRKNGSTLPRPLPRPKLNGETDSNHSRRRKKVGDRSDPRRDSNNSGGMVLRSGRQLPSMPPQEKAQSSRSNTNMNGPGRTCQRKRDSELMRVNGQIGEHHLRTCHSKHDDDDYNDDYNGDDGDNDNNNDDEGDGDDDGDVGSNDEVEPKGPDPQEFSSEEDDHDDHCGGGGAAAAAAAAAAATDDDDVSRIERLECQQVTARIRASRPAESEEAISKDGLNKPDKGTDITTGDQMPGEYRKGNGCNEKRATDKVAGRTGTHSEVYGSGSEKYTTDHEDLTLPMANLSISHTKEVTKKKPAARTCAICLEEISNPKTLDRCGHVFCTDCIEDCFARYKPVCPSCNMVYGVLTGNQPEGTMNVAFSGEHLPGNDTCGMITITYHFPNGTQRADHPNPGDFYKGTTRVAYLPDCREGRDVLRLLRKAFDRKLTFTVGRSTTTGRENVVTWNDIHHKTSVDGGPTRFGYPDETYLTRVMEELASKGVTGSN